MIKLSNLLSDHDGSFRPEPPTPETHTPPGKPWSGLRPQLLNPVPEGQIDLLLADPLWWLQPKHSGQRRLVVKDGPDVAGLDHAGLPVTLPEPMLHDALQCGTDFVLDGAAMDDRLIVFDLLALGDLDLRPQPYLERYLLLMHLLSWWERRYVRIVQSACVDEEKRRIFEELKSKGREGIVFRKIDEPYREGRPPAGGPALEHRSHRTASFVVSRQNEEHSVNLVVLDDGVARNAGRVTIPPGHPLPEIGQVVEVLYLHASRASGHILQPEFLGIRGGVLGQECTLDKLVFGVESSELAA